MATWEAIYLLKLGADFCAGYLLFFYLIPQVGFFIFVACNQLFLGDRSLGEHRKLVFPWFDLALVGFGIQLVIIAFNFIFNTHKGHC
jgi:hypothetical protein